MVISLCSAENRLQAPISKRVNFLGCFPVGGQLLLVSGSVASELKLCWFIRSYVSQAVFQNIRKLYSGETIHKCYNSLLKLHQYMYYCICGFTRLSCIPSIFSLRTLPIYSLGTLSGIDGLNDDHLKLLGYEVVLQRLQPIPQFL